jgi:hypothetical protein
MTYWRLQTYGSCAKDHPSAACQTAKNPCTYYSSNCRSKHQAWDSTCLVRNAETEYAAAAYATRLTLYKVNSNIIPAALSPLIHFNSLPHTTLFISNQRQQLPQPRTIHKQAWQSAALVAEERADDGSVTAP